jgi:hypothetical protein
MDGGGMSKLAGILAVAGASLFGAIAVLGAVHFRDNAEVPKWAPPSAAYAPMMAGLAAEAPAVAPRQVAAPIQPAPVVAKPIAMAPIPAPPPPAPAAIIPPPPPAAAEPTPEPIAMPPPPVAPPVQQADLQDLDDDEVSRAQADQQRRLMEANKLHALDMRNAKRAFNRPRLAPQAQPAAE